MKAEKQDEATDTIQQLIKAPKPRDLAPLQGTMEYPFDALRNRSGISQSTVNNIVSEAGRSYKRVIDPFSFEITLF